MNFPLWVTYLVGLAREQPIPLRASFMEAFCLLGHFLIRVFDQATKGHQGAYQCPLLGLGMSWLNSAPDLLWWIPVWIRKRSI